MSRRAIVKRAKIRRSRVPWFGLTKWPARAIIMNIHPIPDFRYGDLISIDGSDAYLSLYRVLGNFDRKLVVEHWGKWRKGCHHGKAA